ncbi:MAG: glycerophosphodiester phosphodiesterase, partial [Alphaproteobacteria bacterium]|nr:glycerophosphodiester phosphodiesterase [Alphaproteobacteria bacterium]
EWPRGLLLDEYVQHWKKLAEHIDTSTININGNKVTQSIIDEYLDLGKPILAYTINDPSKAKELMSWGVSSVFSDCPDVIRDEIESIH